MALVLILNVAVAFEVGAVTDEEIYAGLRFSGQAPGGRLAGMGGAGLALVDDAGAAHLNPARLCAINAPELVIEATNRSRSATSTHSDFFRFDTSVNSINRFAGASFRTVETPDDEMTPAFLAYAHPLKLRSRPVVLALSRTAALDTSFSARSVNLTTPLLPSITPSAGDVVRRISEGHIDADLELYDLSAGWRLTPSFSVGGALILGRLQLSSRTVGLLADPLQFTGPGMFDPRFSGSAAAPLVETSSDGNDTDVAFSFGAWWRPHRDFSVATVYRQGTRFGVEAVSRDLATGARQAFVNVIKEPDVASVGLAWTPFGRSSSTNLQTLTFALDLSRVEYSDVLAGLRTGENVLTRSDFIRDVSYTADDAVEARLGMEYRRSFLTWTLAWRGGVYTEHDAGIHLTRAAGDVGALQGQARAMSQGEFFPGRDTELHGTLGVGARFYSVGFDLGVDLAEDYEQASVSMTWRLGEGR